MTASRGYRYPTDCTEEEWAFAAPYLTLLPEDAGQRRHDLRASFDALRWLMRAGAPWRLLPGDFPPWHAVYDQAQRWIAAGVFATMVGDLLALHVTPASDDDRAQVGHLTAAVQQATGSAVEVAYVDQGYTGSKPAEAARRNGIALEVVKLPEAKRGFVLLPRRWVVERSFAWLARFRRLSRDYERLPSTLTGLHWLAFACLLLSNLFKTLALSS